MNIVNSVDRDYSPFGPETVKPVTIVLGTLCVYQTWTSNDFALSEL